jgi:predicted glycosyltransferase involved in capsule biosynthesis
MSIRLEGKGPYIGSGSITVCTTNMNRNEYLVKALPTWLDRGFKEIIIVDWNSDKPIIRDLKDFKGENIRIIRVDDQVFFNCTKSRNLSAEFCTSPYVWFMDGDVEMTFKRNTFPYFDSKYFYHGTIFITGAATTGSCLMEKNKFDEVNGYSELITTLPGEDLDLYKRLEKKGYSKKYFPFGSLKHIPHPYALRTKHRPWFGYSRAAGTRVTFKQVEWNSRHKQLSIPHKVLEL